MSNKLNIIDKIWRAHVVEQREGYPDILAIDLHLIHEVTSPQAFAELRRRGLSVLAPGRCVATVDHIVSTGEDRADSTDAVAEQMIDTLRSNCRESGIRLFDIGSEYQGIVHVMGPELGLTQPGMTIVCGDSHTATHGAFGALAFGIGTTDVLSVLATGCLLQHKPKTMRVAFDGLPTADAGPKDIILRLISKIGVGGANGYVIEYTGEAVRALSMEERMTLCNMSIECGARAGLIAPDKTTFVYLRACPATPDGARWKEALTRWQHFVSDDDAVFDTEIRIDIAGLEPMVTWGTNPAQAIEIGSVVPHPQQMDPTDAEMAAKALEYTRLEAGKPIEGTPIDYVFIGSCTNGRISDLRAAAQIMRGRTVADGVTAFIVPGSEQVRRQAVAEGLDRIFTESGAQFRAPGCSMCLAMNDDKVPAGKRCASTSNRNFIGRQGDGAITHLMSPRMAAAAAVAGRITHFGNIV